MTHTPQHTIDGQGTAEGLIDTLGVVVQAAFAGQ